MVRYVKISKGGDYFITMLDGLDIDEILDLTQQTISHGYSFESSSELEYNDVEKLSNLARNRMQREFNKWEDLINWDFLI